MARFILDVNTSDIRGVYGILDRDNLLASCTSTIVCIDESNENQFYHSDGEHSPMDNKLTDEQIRKYNHQLRNWDFGGNIQAFEDSKGEELNEGDEVILIDMTDLDREELTRGTILTVKNLIHLESNFIDFEYEEKIYSFYGHRVIKI